MPLQLCMSHRRHLVKKANTHKFELVYLSLKYRLRSHFCLYFIFLTPLPQAGKTVRSLPHEIQGLGDSLKKKKPTLCTIFLYFPLLQKAFRIGFYLGDPPVSKT